MQSLSSPSSAVAPSTVEPASRRPESVDHTSAGSTAVDSALPAAGNSASSASALSSSSAPAAVLDEETCRICMDGEDAELGRLFVPCQCKGTAKFVHEECLRQWRTKDESMAFFICGMCGSRYRLRKRWHLVVAFHRATVPALTVLLAFAVSTLAGFLAPPLMRWVSRYFYVPDRAAPLREWALTDLLTLGDAVREPVSAFGSLVGDCRWAAGRELHWEDITTPEQKAQGTTMSAVLDRGITACGRRWGVERDEYVAGSSGTRAGMHLTAGAALVGVGWVLVSQLGAPHSPSPTYHQSGTDEEPGEQLSAGTSSFAG
ncbi:hypothetical protein JCM10213_004760, partial [Rhodosporidiobolus nylandii]